MSLKKTLYWFTHDQRLQHNRLFHQVIENSDEVAFIYVIDPTWLTESNYQHKVLGQNRRRFLYESLDDLSMQLNRYGYELTILMGQPVSVVSQFINEHQIDTLAGCTQFGYYERQHWVSLSAQHPSLNVVNHLNSTLLAPHQLPDKLSTFTAFRKHVEKSELCFDMPTYDEVEPHAQSLKAGDHHTLSSQLHLEGLFPKVDLLVECNAQRFFAGESAAQYHLSAYFNSDAPKCYKETRNELDGWLNSTKFSPYLANGNLSPRQIWQFIEQYEADVVANESTYWLKFELLWREYFQWLSIKQGASLFQFKGLAKTSPKTTFLAERFRAWCEGNTPYAIVNACMKQLNATGFMSNRGRQLVASCLVNELAVDWRYGAAYFQQQLLDHDVASNWGNWQYIAGVGADPRGGRHFNLEKQTQWYDPEHVFISQWCGHTEFTQIDTLDMTGWPLKENVEIEMR